MGETVKVKLIRTHFVGRPGEIIVAFGHKFEIQPNGDAVCDMHKDFIPTEVAARRVEVIEPGRPRQEIVPELAGFSYDVADYFGAGNVSNLMRELSKLRKELLQEFVLTRFSIEIPNNISNNDILNQIKNLVDRATGKTVLKISKEEKQEPKASNTGDDTESESVSTSSGDSTSEESEKDEKEQTKKSSKTTKRK